LALRIPKAFALQVGLESETPIDLNVQDGSLIVTKHKPPEISLDELLAGVTAENIHGEIELSGPVGNEAWQGQSSTFQSRVT
jgi:antitoxin MazE